VIEAGLVWVGKVRVTNPRALVSASAPLHIEEPRVLRGTVKLRAALEGFGVVVAGRTALDLGASTGGFTVALLEAGAKRVYAVDAGHGQLLGRLRQDPRVVNRERTNLGALDADLIPDVVDIVTMDLSYLAIARAVPQLERLAFAERADLVALVKPMFELDLASAPVDDASIDRARARASAGLVASGWDVIASLPSPVPGAGGARELFVHARRRAKVAPAPPEWDAGP
jgi:23S rRNA (cytidine1920-2'-O)/16S rRNA (cytidine1409-2'-O)-methyltransferase